MGRSRAMMRLLKRGEPDTATDALGPIGTAVEEMLTRAIAARASDVHLDPTPAGTRVRLRVDGFFEEGARLPQGIHERIVARVKVLAGLTVYRREEIQEGAVRRDGGVDLRVSILPTVAGEKVTLRIFDPRTRPVRLEDLAYRPGAMEALGRFAGLRQGLILIAGPSGSGKTTALYAAVNRILESRSSYTNICSIEDPVELALDGVHQVPVNPERGLTFARGLAALLRQDPEVILLGEIRDRETAAIAVEAGMTGHLVLTSVHAGSSAESLTRLLDLGIEPYLVAASVKGVMAQRLVRRNCSACATPDEPDRRLLEVFGAHNEGTWRRGRGCAACRGSGYAGRIPIAEVLHVDGPLAARVLGREKQASLPLEAQSGESLLCDGVERARAGETTLEELARVIDQPEIQP